MNPELEALVAFVKFAAEKAPGVIGALKEYAAKLDLGTPPDLSAWEKVDAEFDAAVAARRTMPTEP